MRDFINWVSEVSEFELLVMDGFDDCLVGVVTILGKQPVACYDRQKVIEKLVSQGMSEEEAREFHEFNQAGAYMGDATPVFLDRPMEGEVYH